MKRISFLLIFIVSALFSQAQTTYKYVIIPTNIPDIGKGINPYQVSSNLQKALNEKSIKSIFETSERPADYCDALIAVLQKESSMLRNKLTIEFRDCMNRVIWSNVGTGQSKEYIDGFAEAIEDALTDFNALPEVRYATSGKSVAPAVVASVQAPVAPPVVESAEVNENYQPQNVYFNEKYLVDYVRETSGKHKLIILNGNSLGYGKMQEIATLVPSDLPGILTVRFSQPDGEIWNGVANETASELKISISSGDSRTVITLQKQ